MRKKENLFLPYDYKNKKENIDNYIRSMLNRLQSMFIYEGLPETIKQRSLELNNMTHGLTIWCNIDEDNIVQDVNSAYLPGGLYALWGDIGGVIDLNYDQTYAIIAHPRLKKSLQLKIGEECVVMRNDSLMEGMLPILERYCTMIAENDISLNLADIMTRATALITAGDDKTKANAELYLTKLFNGELSVIGELSSLNGFKGIETQPYLTEAGNQLTNLIELHSYFWGRLWNELGIDFNDNRKRESIMAGEAEQNLPQLRPLVDDMLHCRITALEEINKMFNTDIKVSLHSAWLQTQEAHEENDANNDLQLDEAAEITPEATEEPQSEETEQAEQLQAEEETELETAENAPESETVEEVKAEAVEEIAEDIKEVIEEVKEEIKEEAEGVE